jgi:hypothetical protein
MTAVLAVVAAVGAAQAPVAGIQAAHQELAPMVDQAAEAMLIR